MRTRLAITLSLTCLLASAALSGCSTIARLAPPSASPIPPAASKLTTATNLGSVEINNYKGKRLDVVASEPENSIKGPQTVDIGSYHLGITGLVKTPLSLSYHDVTSMPAFQKVTTLNCVEGWSVTYLWTGVKLKDLFERAGYDPAAKVVIFKCHDGYTTSLPLDYIVNNNILLAYKMNGVTMPPARGYPFQVVAENQLGYKWAKWVTEIQISNDTSYRGYWEQRGYNNTATINSSQ